MIEYIQTLNNLINTNIEVSLILVIALMSVLFLIKNPKKRLKKTNYKKVEHGFYNTGFKTSTSFYDIFKFKLRIFDFDDSVGVNYIYLIQIKFFKFELCRMKYKNQKGLVIKRNTTYTNL